MQKYEEADRVIYGISSSILFTTVFNSYQLFAVSSQKHESHINW